jgi:4-hydroxyphenylpyruvate dioxygenase
MGSHEFDYAQKPAVGFIKEFDYARLYVANAFQTAAFYTTRLGFQPFAYQGLETGSREYCSYAVELAKVRLVFTSPLSGDEREVNRHITTHGDGVSEVAFTVDNAEEVMRRATERGAKILQPLTARTDDSGTVWLGTM